MTGCPSGSLEVVSGEQSLSHELAHLFGVFHPAVGVRSVMRGYAHDVFDPQMVRVVRLMRSYDFRRGVAALDEATRRQWTAIWDEGHVPDEANSLAKAVHNLGVDALRANNPDAAVARFQEAIAIDKSYASPHALLGIVWSRQGKLDAATAELRLAKSLDFRQLGARSELGYVLVRQGKLEEASWEYRDALMIDRRYAPARLGLAAVYFQAEKYREAWAEVAEMRALGITVPPAFLERLRAKMPEPGR
jgi:Flp pilus assembly protein TadD